MAEPGSEPIDPDSILRRSFTSVRRGLDPLEVQKYLLSLATELRAAAERERDLKVRLEQAERRATEMEDMAPSRLHALVGQETARVLEAANAAAEEMRISAEEKVARMLRDAQDQSKAELESARQRGREMVAEAQKVRERMVRDVAKRRRVIRLEAEELVAGRRRLSTAYQGVRELLDAATERLEIDLPELAALFAEPVPEPEHAEADEAPGVDGAGTEAEGEPDVVAEDESDVAAEGESDVVADLFARVRDETADVESEGSEEPDALPGGVAGLIAGRDSAVAPLARSISRKVKRELSEEQNELLDAIRRELTQPAAADLLPAPEAHVERFAAAFLDGIEEAAAAGAASVGSAPATPPQVLRELAAEMAADLVAPLRERLGRCFDDAGDDDALVERVRSCYREWRTQQVDAASDRAVLAAWNRGVLESVDASATLRWLVDDGGSPSPDCEDNALAGDVVAREPFPTGHASPPAHPTCRCLLVSATVVVAAEEVG